MKYKLIIMALTLFSISVRGQENSSVSLDSCLSWASTNYPLSKANPRYEALLELKKDELAKNFYPKVDLNMQASYQSDVATIPLDFSNVTVDVGIPGVHPKINFPTIAEPPHDNYKATLDVSQLIYDGGMTKNQRQIDEADLLVNEKSTEVELYKVKENVSDIYFGILQLQESMKILELTKKDIQNQLDKMDAVIAQGMLLPSEKDVLKAEMISLEQKIIEIEEATKSSFRILSILTGKQFSETSALSLPEKQPAPQFVLERPEYYLLGLQQDKIEKTKLVLNSRYMPKVAGFGQAGYGKPGMNVFSNEFNPWYMVGVTVKWKIWDWSTNKTDLQMVDVQKDIIEYQKEAFSQNLKTGFEKNLADIEKFTKLLDTDKELIDLRTKIKETASSQHLNGTITTADYLTKVNEEARAKLQLKSHEIQLIKAKYDNLKIVGRL